MRRLALFVYGLAVYVFFFIAMRYFLCFLENIWIDRRIDFGAPSPLGEALAVDLGLLLLFGAHHSVMARPAMKRLVARFVPDVAERATYVLFSTLLLLVVVFRWRSILPALWTFSGWASHALIALSYGGWLLAAWATAHVDHFALFGVTQVYRELRGRPQPVVPFTDQGPYRFVRHPMYLGFLIASWATPTLTAGHFLYAAGMTVYVLIGIAFEERELRRRFGETYEAYRARTPMLLPLPLSRRDA